MPVSGAPKEIVHQELHKFKHGQLHSGSDHGPKVTNRKQAIAIALNVARRRGRARGGYADGGLPDDAVLPTDRYDSAAAPRSLAGIVAPGLTRYLTESAPPPQITPNAAGKVPPADYNPNVVPAMQDVANLGMAAIPFGRAASVAGEAAPIAARAAETMTPRGSAAGMRTLGTMTGAMPITAAAAPASTSPAVAPPPSAVIEALGPRPSHSPDDQATVDRLNQEIAALATKRASTIKGLGPRGASVQAAGFDTQIKQRSDQVEAIQGQLAKRQADYDDQASQFAAEYAKKTAPFAMREPGMATAASTAPLVSMGAGAVLGGLAGRKITPLKRAATYGAAGLGGGLEGLVGGYLPTYEDLKMPPGSVAHTQAEAANEDPKFWKGSVMPEVGMSAALGLLGAKYGMIRRTPPAATASSTSSTPALAREATGNVARSTSTGKVFQDQAGRWREHGSGRFVAQPAGGGRPAGQMLNAPDAHAKGGAVATALEIARRQGRAIGGQAPWQIRSEARGEMFSGPIRSMVAGRTDHIPLTVASGSYVLPAQHVSHLGQNNTESGFARLGHMFSTGPFGTSLPTMARGRGAPPAPRAPATSFAQGGIPSWLAINAAHRAFGGAAPPWLTQQLKQGGIPGDGDHGVEIMAAGGEFVLPPHVVRAIGNGNIHHGHQVLDAWVESTKKKHATTIAKLPGPAQD